MMRKAGWLVHDSCHRVPVLAATAFSGVCGLHGALCAWRFGGEPDRALVAASLYAAWAIAVAAQLGLLAALRHPRFASPSPFVSGVSATLAAIALVATLWTLAPLVTTSLCL